jgi:hypothetical protein
MYVPEIYKIYYGNIEAKASLEELDTVCHIIKKLRCEFKLFGSKYHKLTNLLKDSSRQLVPNSLD